MNTDDAEEYTQALGQVVAGGYRQVALGERLGVPTALGLSTREWVEQRLGGYVRMAIPERQKAVAELSAEGFTQRETAAILGVAVGTVNADLNPVQNRTEGQGDQVPEQQEPPLSDESPVQIRTGDQPVVAGEPEVAPEFPPFPVRQEEADAILADIDEQVAARAVGTPEPESLPTPKPKVQVNEGDEWYTPQWLFDALGVKFEIDVCAPLDPTYSSVPAARRFTIEDDGLAQPWEGTVWCNPPYSKPEPWARRMIHHRDGLLLTHIPMNAGWCVDLWETCEAIRLFQAMEFVRPDGAIQRPGYWLQLAAFGPVATEALSRLQPLGQAAANKRRVASPMWRRAA